MWIANIDKIEVRHRIDYSGQEAYLVPIQTRKWSVEPGENLIIGVRDQGVVGYGKILSGPMKLSNINRAHRQNITHDSYLHVYISTEMFLNIGVIFPWSVFRLLPVQRNYKQPLVVSKKYFYFVGHYTYWCIRYLIDGELHDDNIFGRGFFDDSNFTQTFVRRLHAIHDEAKRWLLAYKCGEARKTNSRIVCNGCGVAAPIDDASYFQLHYVGAIQEHAPYLKKDFKILCPNCHAVANYKLETAERLV